MYLVTITHRVWGESQETNYEVSSMDEVPETIAEHVIWLSDNCGVEIEDDLEYGLDLSIVESKEVTYNEKTIFVKAENVLGKMLEERQAKREKQILEDKKRQLERLKKELEGK